MIKEKDRFRYSLQPFKGYKFRAIYLVEDNETGEQLTNVDVYTNCENKQIVLLAFFRESKKKYPQPLTAQIIHFTSKEEQTLRDIWKH